MPLVWTTAGDDKVCTACEELDGHVDGDGWCSLLVDHSAVWVQQPNGTWLKLVAGDVPSGPPLHDACRCSTVHDGSAKQLLIVIVNPSSTGESIAEWLARIYR